MGAGVLHAALISRRDLETAATAGMIRRMGTAPDAIKRLIDHFDRQSDQVRSPDYNEAQLRIDFLNPMFRELGWDVDNTQGFAEQYREVVYEDRLKVGGATKAPDYSFRIGGPRKFFLEAKKPSVNLKESVEPAYQLRRYGWSAKLAVSAVILDSGYLTAHDLSEPAFLQPRDIRVTIPTVEPCSELSSRNVHER